MRAIGFTLSASASGFISSVSSAFKCAGRTINAMPSEVTITLDYVWQDYEPEGETCEACGDAVLLKGRRLYMRILGAIGALSKWQATEVCLCQSCSQFIP